MPRRSATETSDASAAPRLRSAYRSTSAASGNLRPGDGGGAFDHLAELGIGGVPVPPGDVAAGHAGLLAGGGVVGAAGGEVAQGGELRLGPVSPRARRGGVGELEGGRPGPPP